jgi:hypothetical protein
MQHTKTIGRVAAAGLASALLTSACSSAPTVMHYSETAGESDGAESLSFFTRDATLYQAALRAQQRIEAAIGEPGLVLSGPAEAERCEPFRDGCGFELWFDPVVYCQGDPDPALACTSQGAGGKALGVAMQADLLGEELDNRLIHELFHVITYNRAPHAVDGLFMEYTVGTEPISAGTLNAVCDHFACRRFVVEEDPATEAGRDIGSHF